MFADGDDSGFGEWSFDGYNVMERKETARTLSSMLELEDKLYGDADEAEGEQEQISTQRVDFGYNAHVDGVDQVELGTWRRNFAFLRVDGRASSRANNGEGGGFGYKEGESSDVGMQTTGLSPMIEAVGNWTHANRKSPPPGELRKYLAAPSGASEAVTVPTASLATSNVLNLMVVGKAIVPSSGAGAAVSGAVPMEVTDVSADTTPREHTLAAATTGDEGGVEDGDEGVLMYVHGECAEYVEYHHVELEAQPSSTASTHGALHGAEGSPLECQKEEVLSLLFDTVWSGLQDNLVPIVKGVLAHQPSELGDQYVRETTCTKLDSR